MNVEEMRLRTFENWPEDPVIEPYRIAAAGFYCNGPGSVKCYSCNIEISNWEYGDQVMSKHRLLSPECAFVRDPERAGNIPLLTPRLSLSPSQPNGREGTSSRQQEPSYGRWVSQSSIYKSEQARLDSFTDWPIPFIVRPEALAATGFYFLRQGDKVQCAFCSGGISRWERGDIPKEEHRRHFPNCPFLMGLPVGNVPRTGHNSRSTESLCDPSQLAELGIQPHRGPRHPKYSTVESRLQTFERWPDSICQRPTDLAQAGFFRETDFTPQCDLVRCFHCDGGLRNWEPGDTPWREHARWFPTCQFLLLVKGPVFVKQVQDQFRNGPSNSQPTSQNEETHESTSRIPPSTSSTTEGEPSGEGSSAQASSVSSTAPTGAEALEEENRRLKDARICKICMDADIGTVLLPCGHLVACIGCAPSLLDCPMCRVAIKATVRTFLS